MKAKIDGVTHECCNMATLAEVLFTTSKLLPLIIGEDLLIQAGKHSVEINIISEGSTEEFARVLIALAAASLDPLEMTCLRGLVRDFGLEPPIREAREDINHLGYNVTAVAFAICVGSNDLVSQRKMAAMRVPEMVAACHLYVEHQFVNGKFRCFAKFLSDCGL
jgi:hypothetical protein